MYKDISSMKRKKPFFIKVLELLLLPSLIASVVSYFFQNAIAFLLSVSIFSVSLVICILFLLNRASKDENGGGGGVDGCPPSWLNNNPPQ